MRGRTLNDAFIILDEAQNTTPEQMKMFLTRIGLRVEGRRERRRHPGGPRQRPAVRPPRDRGDPLGDRRASRSAGWAGATSCGTRSSRTSSRRTTATVSSDSGWPSDGRRPSSGRRTGRASSISNRQDAPVDEEGLRALARDTLRGEGSSAAELSVSFVEQDEIDGAPRAVHGRARPDRRAVVPARRRMRRGRRPAPRRRRRSRPRRPRGTTPTTPTAELRLLLVHGILHLLGYDHEDDGARTRMWERQERYSGVRAP